MRIPNKALSMKAICRGVPWLALFLTLGCAHDVRPTLNPGSTTNEPVEPPTGLVNVEQDAGGFTITQSVLVTDEVRADYEAAVHMLEEAQYEPGIDLLLKVTEQAPALTAAPMSRRLPYTRKSPW